MIFLKSLDEGLWFSILDGWCEPTKVDPKNKKHTIPKPFIEWSEEEKSDREMNVVALDMILSVVTQNEYKLLTTCTSSKSAWDILRMKFKSGDDRALMTLTNVTKDTSSKEYLKLESKNECHVLENDEDDDEGCEDSNDENFKIEENKGDGEVTIQEAFDNLYTDFVRISLENQKVKNQNESLLSEIINLKSLKISKLEDDVKSLRCETLTLKERNAKVEFELEIKLYSYFIR